MTTLPNQFGTLRQGGCNASDPAKSVWQGETAYLSRKPRLIRHPANPATGLYPWKVAGCQSPADTTLPNTLPTDPNQHHDHRPQRHNADVALDPEDPRDQIAQALQANTPTSDTSVLVGWVAVAEYITPSGERYLAAEYGTNHGGDHTTTSWQRRGYLHEALHACLIDDVVIDLDIDLDDTEADDVDDEDEL